MTAPWTPSQRSRRAIEHLALAGALAMTMTTADSALLAGTERAPNLQTSAVVAFTPGQALPLVLDTIRGARTSILVAAYAFTSRPIAVALRDAARGGVKVFVVVDAGEAATAYSAAQFLANARVPVRLNARYALQHNKFMVIDGASVQTGSLNYTASAGARNAENVLVLRNAPMIAAQYEAEWQRLWNEGTDLPPTY
ncbi:phospholipase D family nuclease [Variovorax saccharolyticus]|uniref:phospholipase D family nuclease n=1 Tax=Variovorax saccharolyticus TaxID=3053516 RepID=UPI0025756ABD|nr:phospholipase D family protein [Variovorax sp. J31P216]MDM0030398.1 phospholipase D family protein [Variovorax sp. J31P216]